MSYENYFPRPCYYENQKETMDEIHTELMQGKLILFEGACGSGKTLTALVPALDVGKQLDKVVIVATSMRTQMLQFIEEAKGIKRKIDIKSIVLRAKMTLCPLNHGLQESKYEVGYDECDYRRKCTKDFYKVWRKNNQHQDINIFLKKWKKDNNKEEICIELLNAFDEPLERFKEWIFSDVRSPDEIADWGFKNEICVNHLIYAVLPDAELIICNSRLILDEGYFNSITTVIERKPDELIVIFDEAHNIESVARDVLTDNLTESTIEWGLAELKKYSTYHYESDSFHRPLSEEDILDLIPFLESLLDAIRKTCDEQLTEEKKKLLTTEWSDDIRIAHPKEKAENRKDLFIANLAFFLKENHIKIDNCLNPLEMFGDWVKEINGRSSCRAIAEYITKHIERTHMHEFFPYMGVKKHKKNDDLLRRVGLYNTIPRIITKPLLNSIYAVVLMSATLEPFEMIKQTLGITRPTFEKTLPLMFPLENRKTIVVTNDIYQRIDKNKEKYAPTDVLISCNKNTEESTKYVKDSLENIIKGTDGNVLVFFSSRSEMEKYEKLIKSDVPILCNKSSSDANDNKELFFAIGEMGGKSVLLSYLGGTLTEGIDFKDGRARTVVVVGIGYPNLLDDKVIAVRTAYREEFGADKEWDYAVEIPTIRKVRQAMGRVVRSPQDFGARILLDRRFDGESCRIIARSVYEKFPPKENIEFETVKNSNIRKFIGEFYSQKMKNNDHDINNSYLMDKIQDRTSKETSEEKC